MRLSVQESSSTIIAIINTQHGKSYGDMEYCASVLIGATEFAAQAGSIYLGGDENLLILQTKVMLIWGVGG
jgi:hypothetical protein